MPIHLLVLFFLFIMSNLFYRGGWAGFYLSILKETKKNYMGRSICLFICKKMHNSSAATFNTIAILYRLNKYDFSNNMS